MRTLLLVLLTGLVAGCGLTDSPKDKAARPSIAAGYHPPLPIPVDSMVTSNDPWTRPELLSPSVLASQIHESLQPTVFDMGPAGTIRGARKIGPAQEPENLAKLRTALKGLPKDEMVVVYCGCCPFKSCPNVRPAFAALKAAGFTKARLLNLPHNLKTDWIDQGYPMELAANP